MTYTVTLRFQSPAWDEVRGIDYYVNAATKAEAIAIARRRANNDGHTPSTGKGRAVFTAKED